MEQEAKESELGFVQRSKDGEERYAQGGRWLEKVCEWGIFLRAVWFCVNGVTPEVNPYSLDLESCMPY